MSAPLESRLNAEPYVLSSPQDLAAALRSSTADFQATTALIAAIALFVGRVPHLQHAVDDRHRADPRGRPPARRRARRRRQVMRFILTQALALGVIGSLLGLVLGFAPRDRRWSASSGPSARSPLDDPALPLDVVAVALARRASA